MVTSRFSSKSQTTIPHAVREALKLRAGDDIVYVIQPDGRVVMTRSEADPVVDPFRNFTEWDSEEDEKGYADL